MPGPHSSPRARGAGPKPKPTALRILEGNPSKRPLNQNEPKPRVKLPPCPPHLNDVARKEWRRVGRLLLAQRMVTELDGTVLGAYCQQYALWVEAVEMLGKAGTLWETTSEKTGEKILRQSPYVALCQGAVDRMARFLAELGMSPSSRSRVHTVAAEPSEEDELEQLRHRRESS